MCVVRSGSSARKDGSGSIGYAVMRRLRGWPLGAGRVNGVHHDGTDDYFCGLFLLMVYRVEQENLSILR